MNGVESGVRRAATGAARQRLVVGERPSPRPVVAAKSDIVHRAAARCRNEVRQGLRQGSQHRIDDALRSLDIAGRNRMAAAGVHDARLRQYNLDRAKAAGIERGIAAQQTHHRVVHGRPRDGGDRVDRPGALRCGAREVDEEPSSLTADCDPDVDSAGRETIVVEGVFEGECTRRD